MPNTNGGAEDRTKGGAGDYLAPPVEAAGAGAPTLAVSGVVLSKAQLVALVRSLVPNVVDIQPLPGADHFSLLFGADTGAGR